jgi:hypothetical protein
MSTTMPAANSMLDHDGYVDIRWIDLCERLITEFPDLPQALILKALSDAHRTAHLLGMSRCDLPRLGSLLARETLLAGTAEHAPDINRP